MKTPIERSSVVGLEVEVRKGEQPDERRNRARRVGERHVPHLHRLHADDEGVGERRQNQQSGGGAADMRLPIREVHGIGDACCGVQDERKNVQRVVGAKYPFLVRAVTFGPCHLHDDSPEGAVGAGILRRVTERVLTGELVGNLRVHPVQVFDLGREKGASTGFLRELAHDEFRFTESASAGVVAAKRDRVDRRLRTLGQIEYFLERDEARGVLAVREHDEGLAAHIFLVLRLDLAQLLERDVDGVVQRRRAAGYGLENGGFELGLIRGEGLPNRDPAVEVDDLREVVRLQALDEVRCGHLKRRQLVFHARAAVEQERKRDWLRPPGEKDEVVFDAVLEYGKVGLVQVCDVMVGAVDDRDVERDDVDSAAKLRALRSGQCGRGRKNDHRTE